MERVDRDGIDRLPMKGLGSGGAGIVIWLELGLRTERCGGAEGAGGSGIVT